MKIMENHITQSGEVWFRIEKLNRSTDILVQQLYTPDEVEELQKHAVKDYVSYQVESYFESKSNG